MKHSTAESTTWALLGALLAGEAGHWFITPIRHPNAPTWRVVVTGIQLVVGLALCGYALLLHRREQESQRAAERFDHAGSSSPSPGPTVETAGRPRRKV